MHARLFESVFALTSVFLGASIQCLPCPGNNSGRRTVNIRGFTDDRKGLKMKKMIFIDALCTPCLHGPVNIKGELSLGGLVICLTDGKEKMGM